MPIVQIGEVDLSCLPLLFIERQKLKVKSQKLILIAQV